MKTQTLTLAFAAALCAGCHGAPATSAAKTTPTATPAAPLDPLGVRPEAPTPPAFQPPAPVVFRATNGITVWLLERHAVPMVSINITVPSGSSTDPSGKAGVAFQTANMMDEGAGSLGALDLARAVDGLGASLSTRAAADSSFASLTTLKRNLADSFALLADVVARPKFEEKEWARVHELWQNDLRSRASDPRAIFGVLYSAAVFGQAHPYGHPVDGTTASAAAITRGDLKSYYESAWRPDRATLVAVGDVTRDELTSLMDKTLGSWKAPATPPAPPLSPAPPDTSLAASGSTRVVMVDRPDAPQSMIAVARVGVAMTDAAWPALGRVNGAIGGSFTSRLNQDLREQRGLSYGAGSSVSMTRGSGGVTARAAVYVEKTGEALQALLGDLRDFAKSGLTPDEVAKTRSQARSDLVGDYETVGSAAALLARDASVGLGVDFEAKASAMCDAATKAELDALAARYFDPRGAVVLIIGPRAKLSADIAKLGLGVPEMRDADGNLVK